MKDKSKEIIKKVLNNKYFDLILIIFINIIFFIFCNNIFTLKYEQVDDFMIMNLISKSDGIYSVYGIQIHPIICAIIILLYKTSININWYTVFLLFMQFISFTIIGTVFLKKNRIEGLMLYIVTIIMVYTQMICYIQYTTVSMLCLTSGLVLLMHALEDSENVNKFCYILSVLMITIGCMIRFSTVIIAIPFLLIYFICKLIKDKKIKILKVSLILILAILLVNISFNIFYNINPIYKEFLKFHDARTYLHDYNILEYYENKEIFDKVGWSKNDRDLFYAYIYGDEETYNTKVLEEIKENVSKTGASITDFKENILGTYKELVESMRKINYKYFFINIVILVIFNNILIFSNIKNIIDKKENYIKLYYINLIFLSIIFLHGIFIYLKRPMFRVVISIYIIGMIALMYELLKESKTQKMKIIKFLCMFIILFVGVLEFGKNTIKAQKHNIEEFKIYKEIIEYTNLNKDNVYLYTLVMHDRYYAYSVYEKIPDNLFSNIRPLGDWDTYSENYYAFKERCNIDNLIKSLYEKDNVYLICGNILWREDIDMIKVFIKEHYNIDIKANVIKEFEKDIKIYKLEQI